MNPLQWKSAIPLRRGAAATMVLALCSTGVQRAAAEDASAAGDNGVVRGIQAVPANSAAVDSSENPFGLPAPLNEGSFEALLTNPPFTRALNLSESLVLTGVARINGEPVVTVMDRNTNETFVVSAEQTNIQGWRMVELIEDTDPAATQVHMSVNGETITIRYGAAQLDPVASREGRSRPGAAGENRGDREDRGGDDGGDRSRRGGFDPEAMRRMQNMTDDQRQQMRDFFNSNRDRLRGASPEERQQMVNQAMERVERGGRRR